MRVDNGAPGLPAADADALTRFKSGVSALRRRWYLVLVPVLVGVGLGWLSAPGEDQVVEDTTTYYRASHVLIDQTPDLEAGGSGQADALSQAAYLVNTGEVPRQVAATLGLSIDEVSSSLLGLPRTKVSSVEVQAVGTDRKLVVRLADTAASQLLETLATKAQTETDTERDLILAQLDTLENDLEAVQVQLAGNPPDRPQLEAQQRSLTNQYSLVYEQFTALANTAAPSAGLESLEGAEAIEISESTYERTLDTIRNGADYVTGSPTTTVPVDRGSGDPGPGAGAGTRAVLGGLTGLALGIGLVLLLERFDTRVRRRVDLERVTGLNVVAEIPPMTRQEQRSLEVVAHTQHRSRAAEAYRIIRGSVMFELGIHDGEPQPDRGATVIMVTSANPAEGKTTTVANLAAILAEGGLNVLVVNCDFRRPRVHLYLTEPEPPEGSTAPRPNVTRFGSVLVTDTAIERVRLITGLGESLDANPLDVVATQRKIVQVTRTSFDVILLDTAPFLTTNDASELLSEVDQVLLVARAGYTKIESVRRTAEVLARFEAPVLGIVLNDSDDSPPADYYYSTVPSPSSRRRRSSTGRSDPDPGGSGTEGGGSPYGNPAAPTPGGPQT